MCHIMKMTFRHKPQGDNVADWHKVCVRGCETECVCAHYDFLQLVFENSNTSLCSSGWQISHAWVSAGHNMSRHVQSCRRLMTPHTVTTHTLTHNSLSWLIPLSHNLTTSTTCSSTKWNAPQLIHRFTSTNWKTSDKVKRSAGTITTVTAAALYLDSVYILSTHQAT